MIKKIKLSLFIVIFSLTSGIGSARATGDLVYSDNTNVTIGSANYVIGAGSEATSVVVDTGALTVVVPSGSTFAFISESKYVLNNNAGISQACGATQNSITITGPKTVVITPDVSSGCVVAQGGGGRGVLSTPPTVPVTPVVSAVVCSVGQTFDKVTGAKCNVFSSSSVASYKTYNFGTKVLKNGSKGEAVKELQRFLNYKLNLGLVIDGKLGPKTIKVIKQWQKDNGLVADGLVGPKTKAMMNASVK